MRLTKLKLAGFKSFVDPTTVALPGQLVGVVGPNGCGKSNIMDAVRWVLGESKASELRGESMQDVIFNGSGKRQPVSRASVELVFDNSLGRAVGQWSQYAELAVKRVLTRNGQSDYFINNLKVRRRDITDLFLGTGLGPRAYAIIGQGMISRIIEAKPDDLRVFLEEAAGVSRYKERRKETEGRLADTRENLTRVEDIRVELAGQMERLEAQAEVARQYQGFNDQLTHKQQLLWLLRRNAARSEQQQVALEVERAITELEGQSAALREVEAGLEGAREAHFACGDALHQAQGDLFTVNAEVARLEAEIRHRRESRRQLESRLAQLAGELAHWQEQAERLIDEREYWEVRQEELSMQLEEAGAKLEMQAELLPQAEDDLRTAQEELNRRQRELAQSEQKLQVELAHQANAQRALQQLVQRRERLQQELAGLQLPDRRDLEEKEGELELLREEQAEFQAELAEVQHSLPQLEGSRRQLQQELQQANRDVAAAEARRAALEQMQARSRQAGNLPGWLQRQGLEQAQALWQALEVEPGYEDAVEAVLRERLNAVALGDAARLLAMAADRPGSKFSVVLRGPDKDSPAAAHSLLARVRCNQPQFRAALQDWLAEVDVAADLPTALAARERLAPGQWQVTPGGDLVSRHGVTFFAPDKAEHGLLERQREIEHLGHRLEELQGVAEVAQARLVAVESQLVEQQGRLQSLRRQVSELQNRSHALQVDILKLSQASDRVREQRERLQEQLADLDMEEENERERDFGSQERVIGLREALTGQQEALRRCQQKQEVCERAVRDARDRQASRERELREAQFSQRESQGKLQDIFAGQAQAARQLQRIENDQAECQQLSAQQPAEVLEEELQDALSRRREREQALGQQREALDAAARNLRGLEEQRLRIEQSLEPLRTRISDLKLKEQAAGLNAEQLATQLEEVGTEETRFAEELLTARPQALQQEIGRLQKAIVELGAVNLAALQELETARERKGFLDAQAEDLVEAMETLENAIRRIDRETRELLQSTFDTVNGHFGRLFPELFGGGRAELVMTGEEILDAGIQVIAQPP
ncbi:MAG: hypothetical protein RIR00_2228, partial [Pseudomonadota bacterium]